MPSKMRQFFAGLMVFQALSDIRLDFCLKTSRRRCVTIISDMISSIIQKSHCRTDMFIYVYGTFTHALGFMESQFQILNSQIFHSFQIISFAHTNRSTRLTLFMRESRVSTCYNSLTLIIVTFMTPL